MNGRQGMRSNKRPRCQFNDCIKPTTWDVSRNTLHEPRVGSYCNTHLVSALLYDKGYGFILRVSAAVYDKSQLELFQRGEK